VFSYIDDQIWRALWNGAKEDTQRKGKDGLLENITGTIYGRKVDIFRQKSKIDEARRKP
jgi:hypothetical protein